LILSASKKECKCNKHPLNIKGFNISKIGKILFKKMLELMAF